MYAQLTRPVVMVRIGKQLTRWSTVAALTLVAVLGPTARAQRASSDTFVVSVRSDSGYPVTGAAVAILRTDPRPVLNVATDSAGIALLSPVPQAPFTLL